MAKTLAQVIDYLKEHHKEHLDAKVMRANFRYELVGKGISIIVGTDTYEKKEKR